MRLARTNLGRCFGLLLAVGALHACGSEIRNPDAGGGGDSAAGNDGGGGSDAPVIGPADGRADARADARTDAGTPPSDVVASADTGTPVADSGAQDVQQPPADANIGDPYDTGRDNCVATINMYRAMVGQPPYERWREGEACADQMAANDATTGQPHGAFNSGLCSPRGNGQNECPGWGGPDQLPGCLAAMWGEGPSMTDSSGNYLWDTAHGHWLNMYGDYVYSGFQQHFTRVACGFSSAGWMVQDFQ